MLQIYLLKWYHQLESKYEAWSNFIWVPNICMEAISAQSYWHMPQGKPRKLSSSTMAVYYSGAGFSRNQTLFLVKIFFAPNMKHDRISCGSPTLGWRQSLSSPSRIYHNVDPENNPWAQCLSTDLVLDSPGSKQYFWCKYFLLEIWSMTDLNVGLQRLGGGKICPS